MRNRKTYPRNWRELARECKERAGWQCKECGVKHGTLRFSKWTLRTWPVYLQAAHKRHDPANPNPELVAVCPSCHWRFYRKHTQLPQWMIEKLKHRKLVSMAYCQ